MTLVELSEVLRNLALTLAAAMGAWFAWRRLSPATDQADASVRQAELASRSHARALFRDAAGDLGSDELGRRLAAILILDELTRDHPELAPSSFEIVAAYVRSRASTYDPTSPPEDVSAAVRLMQRRTEPNADG